MHISLSIMRPNPGNESATIDSMHRFGQAAKTQPGLPLYTTMRDQETGELVGLAVWESEEAAKAAGPALMAAVENDDLDAWVAEMRNLRLEEV